MKKTFISLFISVFVLKIESEAQFTRYIVKLKNKGGSGFTINNPLAYLSQRSIDRRVRYGIAIDSTDLPVTPGYITQIDNVSNVTFLNASRWLNAVTIQTSDATAITTISNFPFVQNVSAIASKINLQRDAVTNHNKFETEINEMPPVIHEKTGKIGSDYFNYGAGSFNEIHIHNGEFLHNIGLRGQGMQLAVLDAGFLNYTTLNAFDSINANNQVLGTWDFVAREQSVVEDHSHGMQCLSTIAANIPGVFIGKAPKASFYLFRTEEVATEYPVEEFNWVCGAERADSAGTDVISSSLGYFDFDDASFNHVYADMDGNTTNAAKGADLAAKKGILVFNSVGNEGNNPWHYLGTPSDGDSVVAVGAVKTDSTVGGFSSYGPSADGQIKPNVASVGVAAMIQTTSNTVGNGNGTSFACPNMAGLGTCLWQGFPEFNNMRIVAAMQRAGSKSTNPDDRVGYGIPDMKKAFADLLSEFSTSGASVNACSVSVNWTSKDVQAMKYEIERKAPGETAYTKVGELNPQSGIILATHNYQFNNTLVNVNPGTVSYRIRQIIDTAAASFAAIFTDTASVTISSGCFPTDTGNTDPNKVVVSLQPNPTSESTVLLVVETPYAVTQMPVLIYDNKGRLVNRQIFSKGTGKKSIDLVINSFSAGKYYVKVLNGSKTIGTAELIKL